MAPLAVFAEGTPNEVHGTPKTKSKPIEPDKPLTNLPPRPPQPSSNPLGLLDQKSKTPTIGEALQAPVTKQPAAQEGEIVSKRTADSTTWRNKDGTLTKKQFMTPQFFKKDGQWTNIDTSLIEDKNAGDAGTIFGQAWGFAQSLVKPTETFTVKANDWQARFAPSDNKDGMVRIKKDDSQVGFAPVNANSVVPVVTTSNGEQTVRYYNLWDGVDVEYTVHSNQLKENIVLKNKGATNNVAFTVLGGQLQKADTGQDGYKIKGALNDEFGISSINLVLNNFGISSDTSAYQQEYKDGVLRVWVNKDYLQNLPDKAFPVTIDPGVYHSPFGSRSGGNYVSYKSDGYTCPSNVCNPLAGSVQDSNGVWRNWRAMFYSPYDWFRDTSVRLAHANLHLTQRLGLPSSGGTGLAWFDAWHANCFGYGCNGAWGGSTQMGTVGDIDVTSIYQNAIAAGDWGSWLMLTGEENVPASTYKNFDPDPNSSYVDFTWREAPPIPTITSPGNGATFTDPQASFTMTQHSNPVDGHPYKYNFCISNNPGCVGVAVDSGNLTSTQWTVPDGILQDGQTYYVQGRTFDPESESYSAYSTAVQFKIDTRTGKDSTQTFDTLGPVDVDLATGNVTTSAASHSSSALGGSLGISLDYNSPVRSRNGLNAEYWDNDSWSGNPVVKRVDQNIGFDWNMDSPAAGIPADHFSARWKGYFVTPKTGTYQFGAANDDAMKITVNGIVQRDVGCCSNVAAYTGTTISLTAGQVVPIQVDYMEGTSTAYAKLYVKGAVSEQIVPKEWLQTGLRPVAQTQGLIGRYYNDTGDHDFNNGANTLFMQRTDPYISFNWGLGSPLAGGPTDNFMSRWTGYFTAPVAGDYTFGANADDGSRIKVNGTTVMDNWTGNCCSLVYGSAVTLAAGQSVPIVVDQYEGGGASGMNLYVKGAVPEQIVQSQWLSPRSNVLPDGWNLGIDPDGDLNYDRMKINQNSVVLTDSTGDTHEYTWTGSGYKPPVNEDGQLVRNANGTYTLQDTDGRTYVFDATGVLTSVTNPLDDRKPAALKYTYAGSPSHLTQITDGVTPDRWAKVYYSGDANCGSAPAGFVLAPVGMLCAVKTNDGRATYFYYDANGRLARIVLPGNEITDYLYDSNGLITAIRDSAANDAVAAGVRANDNTTLTELSYDNLGRVVSVKQPAATTGATRTEHTIQYLPGDTGYYGATQQHITGATEPNGFSRRVQYDSLFRTTKDTDIANLSDTTEWDPVKDLILSTTDETGLKSTTIYDDDDRAVESYGPAPAAWFGADRRPTASYVNQVPRTDNAYDENIVGASVAWHDYSRPAGSSAGLLSGAPRLHTTGIDPANPGIMSANLAAAPITPSAGMQGIGLSATGKLRLAAGTYQIAADTADGIRVWVDDKLVVDSWIDSASRTVTGTQFTLTDSLPKRFRVDLYRLTANQAAPLSIRLAQIGGFAATNNWASYLKPDYSLGTSTKTYDASIGNSVATTNYGSNPELGLAKSSTTDSGGLNLTTTNTYETQGATGSYLRQTAKYLPGANTAVASTGTQYAYYAGTETRDNPCTTTVEAYKQAGMLKTKTEPDPDGAGPLTGRVTETIYDDAGNVVATRYNTDSWTCTTYDARGRVLTTVIPDYNGRPGRTITNNYSVGGNPMVTASGDQVGTITSTITTTTDLLGRTIGYIDNWGDTTTTTYDTLGRLTTRASAMGTESFTYDNYNRLVNQSLDNVIYATVYYDAFSRIGHIDYPQAGQERMTIGRDVLGRTSTITHRLGNGTTTISDAVTRSQSGQIISGTENGTAKSYTYDKAGRLTNATIGTNTYTYGFGAQNATTCGTASSTNPNSGKNSNRTTQTVNGVATNFCYDYADRLTTSSDTKYAGAQYDSHGNMTVLGTNATPLHFAYDSSDRNTDLEQYDSAGNGVATYYDHDVQGRIVGRYNDSIANWNWTTLSNTYNGYTGSGDTPDYLHDDTWTITEKYLTLPGGVMVTIRPQATGNNQKTYSLPDVHGDVFASSNAVGTLLGTTLTGPFGEKITGQTSPNNTATNGTFGYVGQYQKLTETALALTPIEMGRECIYRVLVAKDFIGMLFVLLYFIHWLVALGAKTSSEIRKRIYGSPTNSIRHSNACAHY